MKLPKYKDSSKKGEDGITILKGIVENQLEWIFRPNHKEHDFGIDAYLDVIAEFGQVTGKTIAAQVKTGSSYFKEKNDFGWIYRGEMAHLNYYLNHEIPVIIIIVDEENKEAFWCLCDPQKTERAGENWKITIPFHKRFNSTSKNELLKYISPVRDYASQLEHFWKMNKRLKESERIVFVVDKPDIQNNIYVDLLSGFERLKVNEDLISHAREKVDVWIHGYNDDPRELHEIPEFKIWLDNVFNGINGWTYFLAKDETAQFLRVIQICNMKFKIIGTGYKNKYGIQTKKIEVDLQSGVPLLEKLFDDLNKFCDEHKISDEINIEICDNLTTYLSGERPE